MIEKVWWFGEWTGRRYWIPVRQRDRMEMFFKHLSYWLSGKGFKPK
jgi:hypothetical protein